MLVNHHLKHSDLIEEYLMVENVNGLVVRVDLNAKHVARSSMLLIVVTIGTIQPSMKMMLKMLTLI